MGDASARDWGNNKATGEVMGCRGNVFVVTGKDDGKRDGFYIYTHWSGRDIPEIVQEALKKEWRWNDPPYLGRIISETFMSHMNRKETGMGISHCLQDNQIGRDLLIVDIPKKNSLCGK
jgi:hypothetical protein